MTETRQAPLPVPVVGRAWLWGVRGAAVISAVLLILPLLEPLLHEIEGCPAPLYPEFRRVASPHLLALFTVPYLAILWRLWSPAQIRMGLGLAIGWSLVGFLIGIGFLLSEDRAVGWVMATLLVTQVALLLSASVAALATKRTSGDQEEPLWRGLVHAGVYLVLFAFVGLAAPNLPSNMYNPEVSVMPTLRTLVTAQITYASTYPAKGFAATLAQLGPPPLGGVANENAADLIDEALVAGEKFGYRFTLAAGRPDGQGIVRDYAISARPLVYPSSGCGSYLVTAESPTEWSGEIYHTNEDRAATLSDPAF